MTKEAGIMIKTAQGLIWIFVLSVLFTTTGTLTANDLENQVKPQAKNAGRQVKLSEDLRISDEEGDFYFKRPSKLKNRIFKTNAWCSTYVS